MQRLAAAEPLPTPEHARYLAWDTNGAFIGMPELFTQLRTRWVQHVAEAKIARAHHHLWREAMDVMGIAVLDGADGLGQSMQNVRLRHCFQAGRNADQTLGVPTNSSWRPDNRPLRGHGRPDWPMTWWRTPL